VPAGQPGGGEFGSGEGSEPKTYPDPSTAGRVIPGDKGGPKTSLRLFDRYSKQQGGARSATDEERSTLKSDVVRQVGARIDSTLTRDQILATPFGQNILNPEGPYYWYAKQAYSPGETVAAALHDNWAASSGDHDVTALALQMAVRDEFGLKGTADPVSVYLTGRGSDKSTARQAQEAYEANGDVLRAYARAEYQNTQDKLEADGVRYLTVWRGVTNGKAFVGGGPVRQQGDFRQFKANPLSSWSASEDTAWLFAVGHHPSTSAYVMAAQVPRERVFSTAFTGAGCLNESEAIVLAGPNDRALVWKT